MGAELCFFPEESRPSTFRGKSFKHHPEADGATGAGSSTGGIGTSTHRKKTKERKITFRTTVKTPGPMGPKSAAVSVVQQLVMNISVDDGGSVAALSLLS